MNHLPPSVPPHPSRSERLSQMFRQALEARGDLGIAFEADPDAVAGLLALAPLLDYDARPDLAEAHAIGYVTGVMMAREADRLRLRKTSGAI